MNTHIAEETDQKLLGWAHAEVKRGLNVLRKERGFNEIHQAMNYVNGEQFPLRARAMSRVTDNRLRKVVQETVSSLTQVRQIWNYETYNPKYKTQGDLLGKLARAWWKNSLSDRKLASALTYSCVGGSGYMYLRWNPDLPGGGDLEIIVFDPRDVIPIDATYTDSIQDWRGVCLRQRRPIADIRRQYPSKAFMLEGKTGTWFGPPQDAEGGKLYSVVSAVWNILTSATEGSEKKNADLIDLLHIYAKDDRLFQGSEPIKMGTGDTEYTVYPVGYPIPQQDGTTRTATRDDAMLYPRGRLIICTTETILDDMPNPFWHGLFPVVKVTLDPLPWSILGAAMVGDLIPLQNALNEGLRGLEDGMAQWIRRGVIADRTALSKSVLDTLDTRKAGMKALLNPSGGQSFQIIDGPQYPPWYLEMLQYYKAEIDDIAGVQGLKELAQLKQMPAADTLDKFSEAQSPILQLRARSVEIALSELAEQLKVNFFQFYTAPRRFQILGPDGMTVEDIDYDPGNLIPANIPGANTQERAITHHENFNFSVAPNSFLEVSHMTQRMMNLQLFREQAMDPWTLWDSMNIGSIGPAPAETVPERIIAARKLGLMMGPTPEMVQAQQNLSIMQAHMAMQQTALMMAGAPGGPGAPPPGSPEEGGGGGAPAGPGTPVGGGGPDRRGRPPTGNQPPQMLQKNGPEGPRTVVSESGR